MIRRPKVTINPPADAYSGRDERIIEFSCEVMTSAGPGRAHASLLGGLISIRRGDGELIVDVYRCDENVRVLCRQADEASASQIGSPQHLSNGGEPCH